MITIQYSKVKIGDENGVFILDIIIPLTNSKESPGRKNPTNRPVSAKMMNTTRYNP